MTYRPTKISKIPSVVYPDSDGEFLDIVAIPVEDRGGSHPRRIILQDEGGSITWTLWDEDATNDRLIDSLMGRCILIRNGIVKHFDGFGGEWQVKKNMGSVRTDFAIERMERLQAWYDDPEDNEA